MPELGQLTHCTEMTRCVLIHGVPLRSAAFLFHRVMGAGE
jgi:hypothetical protein